MGESVIVDSSVTFTLTPDDFVRAYQLAMIKRYRQPRTWLRYGVWFVGVLALVVLSNNKLIQNPVFFITVFAIGICLRLLLWYFVFVPSNARKRFSESKAFLGLITYSWSEQEIQFLGELSSARLPWKDMADHAENDGMLLFYPTPQVMHIVPKRAFTEAQIADVINCASANMDW